LLFISQDCPDLPFFNNGLKVNLNSSQIKQKMNI